jgi:hypothetical protein
MRMPPKMLRTRLRMPMTTHRTANQFKLRPLTYRLRKLKRQKPPTLMLAVKAIADTAMPLAW